MKTIVSIPKPLHTFDPVHTRIPTNQTPGSLLRQACAACLLLLSVLTAHAEDEPEETVIESERLEMISGETVNHFYFEDTVRVRGTNLKATADRMEVVALRVGDSTGPTVGRIGSIQRILLTGNVVIEQAGRRATAGRAELLPAEGKVVLTQNPMVVDAEGTVTGYRMTLFQGERKALVEGEVGGDRPRVTLPALQDLGYRDAVSPQRQTKTEQGGDPASTDGDE